MNNLQSCNIIWCVLMMLLAVSVSGCGASKDSSKTEINKVSKSAVLKMKDGDLKETLIIEPSIYPPGGLDVKKVPLFVVFGDDDNGYSGLDAQGNIIKNAAGTAWLVDMFSGINNPAGRGNSKTFDGSQVHFSLMGLSEYVTWENRVECKKAWRMAYEQGHEIGNHTATHPHGTNASVEDWKREILTCNSDISKPWDPDNLESLETGIGVPALDIIGFRSPYLQYNDDLFTVLEQNNFKYDCSIEEGYENNFNGRDLYWPYTLHNGTPANPAIKKHPSIIELPVYPFVVPPDDKCNEYGVKQGLRSALAARESGKQFQKDHAHDYVHLDDGRIRGLDYDLWQEYNMTAAEFLATLKYTLDERLSGNRAPMTICMHTDFYVKNPWDEPCGIENHIARQHALKDFFDYAHSKRDVRIVSGKELVEWLQNPVEL